MVCKNGIQQEFTDSEGKTYVYGYPIWFAITLTFGIGFASGLFGIGGGSMIVPAMIILFLFPTCRGGNIDVYGILTSIVNSASHVYFGHVPWLYTIPVIPGAYVGAKLGAALNKRIKSDTLVLALRIILLLLGIRSIIEGILA